MKLSVSFASVAMAALMIITAVSLYYAYYFSSVASTCLGDVQSNYDLLSPHVAWMNADQFLSDQQNLTVSYRSMKQQVVQFFNINGLNGRYAIYFEDLSTGAWVGLDERTQFFPASLLKLPTAVAILKKVDTGDILLDQPVTLTPDDLNGDSGTLFTRGAGFVTSPRELLQFLINESDNTALVTLDKMLTEQDINNARSAIGLPLVNDTNYTYISPKEYSNTFRSLYYSTYLPRPLSQLALSMMSDPSSKAQLQSSLPAQIKVSHKYGIYTDGGYYHDCGIVYYPGKPYMLCVMSNNSTQDESFQAIGGLSRLVYDYVSSH